MKRTNKGGFTLVELVVVIAIIAILMALAIVTINTVRRQSRNAALRNDAQTMKVALESYYASSKAYPSATTATDGYPIMRTGGDLAAYVPGSSTTKPANPTTGSTTKGRLCYQSDQTSESTTKNVYKLFIIPEGSSDTCAITTIPEGNDYSIAQ